MIRPWKSARICIDDPLFAIISSLNIPSNEYEGLIYLLI